VADVVIMSSETPTLAAYGPPKDVCGKGTVWQWHRIIIDEAHSREGAKQITPKTMAGLCTDKRWCVTGTPCSRTLQDLQWPAFFLGHWEGGLRLQDLVLDVTRTASAEATEELIAKLRQVMIRHTKSQKNMQGQSLLSLPDLACSTIWVSMTAAERQTYKQTRIALRHKGLMSSWSMKGAEFQTMDWRINPLKLACGATENSAKLRALRQQLILHRQQDPNMQAVVFTGLSEVHSAVVSMVEKLGIEVYTLSMHVHFSQRTENVKAFQEGMNAQCPGSTPRPKVMVATFITGNCGITLTAASKVFIMEPSVNPSTEIQCAGRIHRLGQNKKVVVHRMCYSATYEEKLVLLQQDIRSGKKSGMRDGMYPASMVRYIFADL